MQSGITLLQNERDTHVLYHDHAAALFVEASTAMKHSRYDIPFTEGNTRSVSSDFLAIHWKPFAMMKFCDSVSITLSAFESSRTDPGYTKGGGGRLAMNNKSLESTLGLPGHEVEKKHL